MKTLFDYFRGGRAGRGAPARRPHQARLSVEPLEDRLLMSASSLAIHAVKDNFGSAVFYLKNNGFYEKDSSGATLWLIGDPHAVRQFSAGVDSYGKADVFATSAIDNSMWEFNSNGWQNLYAPETMTEFAAVNGDRVYAVGADNALWEHSPLHWVNQGGHWHLVGGWNQMAPPAPGVGVQYLDAVTQTADQSDAVVAVCTDGTLWLHRNAGWRLLAWEPNYFQQTSISAGLDVWGRAAVYGLSNDDGFDPPDQLWRWTVSDQSWTPLGTAGTIWQISATNGGQVWFLTTGGALGKFESAGNMKIVDSNYHSEIGAAGSADVYVVGWYPDGTNALAERSAMGFWQQWDTNIW